MRLGLTSSGVEARGDGRHIRPPSCVEHVTFGGVAFELLSRHPLQHDLSGADLRFLASGADPRAVADVACAVHVGDLDPKAPGPERSNTIRFAATAGRATRVWARSLDAELCPLGPRRYAASARLDASAEAKIGLLRGLTSAVLHREGGLMLHAAAVELEGRAVLFVGPSGAGKSTAAVLTEGARCFAYDHVALVPHGAGFLAWGLPGGSPAKVALAPAIAYPLAAVLRVQQAPRAAAPELIPLRGAQALFALRESVECADPTPGGEDVYLHAATKLSSQVAVGALRTVLGRPHGALLRSLLARTAPAQEVE